MSRSLSNNLFDYWLIRLERKGDSDRCLLSRPRESGRQESRPLGSSEGVECSQKKQKSGPGVPTEINTLKPAIYSRIRPDAEIINKEIS